MSYIIYNCDNCQQQIINQRFHCPECDDFDLCSQCSAYRKHKCFQGHDLFEEKGDRLEFLEQVRSPTCIGHCLKKVFDVWEHRPCIGTRKEKRNEGTGKEEVSYEYETYGAIHRRCAPIAWRFVQLSLKKEREQEEKQQQESNRDNANNNNNNDDGNADRDCDDMMTNENAKDIQKNNNTKKYPPMVSIILENCSDWLVWDFAAALSGCVLVPIDVAGSVDVIQSILESTQPMVVLCSSHRLDDVMKIKRESSKLQDLLIVNREWENNSSNNNQREDSFFYKNVQEFFERGGSGGSGDASSDDQNNDTNNNHLPSIDFLTSPMYRNYPYRKPEDVFTLFFTSGSTGKPKGAIVSHQSFRNGSFEIRDRRDPLCFLIYRPLSYATDRDGCWRATGNGGCVALVNNDTPVERWLFGFEMGKLVRPASFSAPPRIFNLMYERFCEEMKEAEEKYSKMLLLKKGEKDDQNTHNEASINDIDTEETTDWSAWIDNKMSSDSNDNNISKKNNPIEAVWKKYRTEFFGNRVTAMTIGSAPPRPEVVKWMKECFQLRGNIRIFESYGTTEAGGITTDNRIAYGAKIKLIPIEGDDVQKEASMKLGKKVRRGEICTITDGMIDGYWDNAEATEKLFYVDPVTKEKWIRTGDIGELDLRDGSYRIVGRINCVTKLANGVFFSPEPVETSLSKNSELRDLCLHAEAGWNAPVAIVSFHDENIKKNNNNNDETKLRILRSLREIGAKDNVPATLLPCAVVISPEQFTRENDLLTTSMKLSRPNIKKRFLKEMEAAIQKIEDEGKKNATNNKLNEDDDGTTTTTQHNNKKGSSSSTTSSIKFLVLSAFESVLRRKLSSEEIEKQSAVTLGADSIQIGVLREKIASLTSISLPLREFGFMKVCDVIDRATFQCFNNSSVSEDDANGDGMMMNNHHQTKSWNAADDDDDDDGANNKNNNNNSNLKPPANVHEEAAVGKNTNNNNDDDQQHQEGMGKRKTTSFNYYDAADLDSTTDTGAILLNKFKEKLNRDISPLLLASSTNTSENKFSNQEEYIRNWKEGNLKSRRRQQDDNNNDNNNNNNRVYFVTGATGFIGIHVLQQLLQKDNKVIVLVRSSSPNHSDAIERLKDCAEKFRIDPNFIQKHIDSKKLLVVRGDISAKTEEDFINLDDWSKFVSNSKNNKNERNIVVSDVILLAANVNHYLPYPQLSSSNVTSNRRLLQFLFDANFEPPCVTFCSSVSVNPLLEKKPPSSSSMISTHRNRNQQHQPRARRDLTMMLMNKNGNNNNTNHQNEDSDKVPNLDALDTFDEVNHLLQRTSSYGLTKWAAERLMENCGDVGLLDPAVSTIARIGMVSWSTDTGAANNSDWLVSLTSAIDIVGKIPLFERSETGSSNINNSSGGLGGKIVSSFFSSMWKSSEELFKKQQGELMKNNKFFMKLSPVNWMAEKIIGLTTTPSSSSSSGGKQLIMSTSDSSSSTTPLPSLLFPEITLLDHAITVEMVSQVWKQLILYKMMPSSSSDSIIVTVVPVWRKFMEELKMKNNNINNTNTVKSNITKSAPSVSQRCELLFGTELAPTGDRINIFKSSDDNKMVDDTNESKNDDRLGIKKFCEFVAENN